MIFISFQYVQITTKSNQNQKKYCNYFDILGIILFSGLVKATHLDPKCLASNWSLNSYFRRLCTYLVWCRLCPTIWDTKKAEECASRNLSIWSHPRDCYPAGFVFVYMEWNEVGRTHSTGDLSQQGLLPEVRRTACTKGVLTKMTKYPKNPGLCALVAYIAGDTLHHQPMGAGHMTVLHLRGPMGFHVLQWCHPMLAWAKRTSYCTRIITLYGAWKVDSGLCISLPFLVDLPL